MPVLLRVVVDCPMAEWLRCNTWPTESDKTLTLWFADPSSSLMGFPGGTSGKDSTCQSRRHKRCGFDPWVRKILWRGHGNPIPVFLPGESPWTEEPSRLSPWGRKVSVMTEWLN